MIILPAIDLVGGKAVRLLRGDYDNMTVYDENPLNTAKKFRDAGCEWMHVVDLEGARDGGTPNFDRVKELIDGSGLNVEIGGGIRNMETVRKYIDAGAARVILGTAAVTDRDFLINASEKYGEKIAVSADVKDGFVAIKGWIEKSEYALRDFCADMESIGIRTMICTDISKDGAMQGTNLAMYRELSEKFGMNFIASGGVSSIGDIEALRDMEIYGAIVGKAYYTGAIDLKQALAIL